MATWNKTPISKAQVEELQKKYNLDSLSASIMLRRGITSGKDILYFMEDDLRFQHSPFCFTAMEDAVDRIMSAQEEKERVLIFGDRDVDGVTATTVLFNCLSSLGIDVRYRLPLGDDVYGLSMAAVDDFAKDNGTLIITVDCGISNNAEIAHAADLGMDIIVLDHHNPPAALPSPAIIVNPKLEDSGYPFKDISGCAVVYKVVSALRFSLSKWYKQEMALIHVQQKQDGTALIECIKIRNLVPVSRLSETVVPGQTSLSHTKIPQYLQGQLLLSWNAKETARALQQLFGSGVEFNLLDIQSKVGEKIPQMAHLGLEKIKNMSKIARYGNHEATEIGGFYNIFVTYIRQSLRQEFPHIPEQEEKDLQLVALAALADIMPMKDENRIFVRNALSSINKDRIRPGLKELMAKVNLLGKRITSTDLSWVLVSHLNAAGRLGHPELAAELFLTETASERERVAQKIVDLNKERKQLSLDAWNYAAIQAKNSIPAHNGKLCIVIDERINRGVSGILAGRLVAAYDVPAMAVTFVENTAIGSMRSCRGYDVTAFLDTMSDIFINHGGHNFAAGFSFYRSRLPEFEAKVQELSAGIKLDSSRSDIFDIDAEIPVSLLTPTLLDIVDKFEPFGESNAALLFMTRKLKIIDALVMGKGEKQHLKLTVDCGKYKWVCLFWNEGERLNRDFSLGDFVDIIYKVERSTFNGMETPQLILSDIQKSA